MPHTFTKDIALRHRLAVAGGALIAVACLTAEPASAQGQSRGDTAAQAAKKAADTVKAQPAGGRAAAIGIGVGGGSQITGGLMVSDTGSANPAKKSVLQIWVNTDSTKPNSTKTDGTKAAAPADSASAADSTKAADTTKPTQKKSR